MSFISRRTFVGALSAAALLAVTACGSSGAASSQAAPASESNASWSYTDTGYGNTNTLDEKPDSLVVDAYSAAAMWDYGIRPTGVFGYGLTEDGGLAVGNADVSQMTIIGQDAEFNLEKLLGLKPDLIVGFGNKEGNGWTWWDEKLQAEATATAPFLGIKFGGRPVVDVIEDYAALAKSLGGDPELAAPAKADFEKKLATLTELAQKKKLKVLALNGYDELYVGQKTLGQLALLDEIGFEIEGQTGDSGWASLSWEKVGDYPADIVLSYSGTAEQVKDHPVFSSLPAVKAGQVVEWDDKRPFTYESYAQWFDELIAVVSKAKDLTK